MTAWRQRNSDQWGPVATNCDQQQIGISAARRQSHQERPRATNHPSQVPNLLNLYDNGQLLIDELITQEYTLDQVQQGYDDQAAGTIIRGVVKFDE